jgi:hypothetical protein
MTAFALPELTDEDREMMRYAPAEHRVFKTKNGRKVLALGTEVNTPMHDPCGMGFVACQDKPAQWKARL